MIKRTLYTIPAFLLFLFTVSVTANAQQVEIGYVNPQEIITKMPEMKAVQQRLQNFAADKRTEIQEKQQAFQAAVDEYQQKMSVLSADAKAAQEKELGQMRTDLLALQQKASQAVAQKQQELVQPLIDSINNAIAAVAEEMGLDYVLNTTTSNGDVVILYTSPQFQQKYDITDEVMDKLGI